MRTYSILCSFGFVAFLVHFVGVKPVMGADILCFILLCFVYTKVLCLCTVFFTTLSYFPKQKKHHLTVKEFVFKAVFGSRKIFSGK